MFAYLNTAVTLNKPQDVQIGSTTKINWTFSGTQAKSTSLMLGIKNVQTSVNETIDTILDLSKRSEDWTVSVATGTYKFYIMDEQFNNYTYSNTFTVTTPTTPTDSSNSTPPQ
ncbi:4467_t:CDS:1, partial [Dentiscutata heterogama]